MRRLVMILANNFLFVNRFTEGPTEEEGYDEP